MRKRLFSVEQMISVLKQAEVGVPVTNSRSLGDGGSPHCRLVVPHWGTQAKEPVGLLCRDPGLGPCRDTVMRSRRL
jgi:hypothetical protein